MGAGSAIGSPALASGKSSAGGKRKTMVVTNASDDLSESGDEHNTPAPKKAKPAAKPRAKRPAASKAKAASKAVAAKESADEAEDKEDEKEPFVKDEDKSDADVKDEEPDSEGYGGSGI